MPHIDVRGVKPKSTQSTLSILLYCPCTCFDFQFDSSIENKTTIVKTFQDEDNFTAHTTLTVEVKDVPNRDPRFTENEYTLHVQENVSIF